MSWPRHMCPRHNKCVLARTKVLGHDAYVVGHDICVLGHVPWLKTFVSWAKTHVSWPGHAFRPGHGDLDRKIRIFFRLRRQKMKVWGSPETRFGQVAGQSEPSSGGKRTVKVCKIFEKKCFRRRKMKRWESPGTRFGKVSCRWEASLGGKRPFEVCRVRRRARFHPQHHEGDGFDRAGDFPYTKHRPAECPHRRRRYNLQHFIFNLVM